MPAGGRDGGRANGCFAGTVAAVRASADVVVRGAAAWLTEGRRVDLQLLGAELGISRATLHRKVGNRDNLLGLALRHLALATLDRAEAELDGGGRPHALRTASVLMAFNAAVAGHRGLRRFLDEEPMTAVRVLMAPRGHVQPAVVGRLAELLERDERDGVLRPVVPHDQLAYALVRLGESFLYADVVGDRTPDVAAANTLQCALLEAGAVRAGV